MDNKQKLKVFLCYSHDDKSLAKRLAESLEEATIDVWWDDWCISAGDSLPQKIFGEGIGDCTHFLALLTPQSIDSAWVREEMDAGFIRKLNGQCKFIPVRYNLPVGELPPNLQGLLSPEIKQKEQRLSIDQLKNDILGVSRKPQPTKIPRPKEVKTGYSIAVSRVAKLFVESSKNGLKFDPNLQIDFIKEKTDLTLEDVEDACRELEVGGFVILGEELGRKPSDPHFQVSAQPSLFVEFDQFWMNWNPAEDGRQLATDIINDLNFPNELKEIAEHYNWKPRRLNPAICYLEDQGLIKGYRAIGTGHFCVFFIEGNRSRIRRLLKSIS